VIVHQSVAPAVPPNYVQLQIDPDSMRRYSKTEVERRSARGIIYIATSFLLATSPIFADWLGILDRFGVPDGISPVAAMVIAGVGYLLLRGQEAVEFVRWRRLLSKRPNEPHPIDLQRFLQLDDEGNYLVYSRSAPCLYPKCNGKIVAEKLPLHEQHRDGLAGVCSVAGKAHSYLIDSNLVATPRDLNWRPPDRPSYNQSY
jgi:hypothetical protein